MPVLMSVQEQETKTESNVEAHQYRVGGEASEAMKHQEAIEMMASERYLLDELAPELRDAYEEHFFGCAECALDVQLGAAFIDHTKVLLPEMMSSAASASPAASANPSTVASPAVCAWPEVKPVKQKRDWFAWLRPAVLAPAFAFLLALVTYQNIVVYPALRAAATEPLILPPANVLHDDTRSGIPVVHADLKLGTAITVEMPSGASYSSYRLECYSSKGKLIWKHTVSGDALADDALSFLLPGSVKLDTYKLVVSGITPTGQAIQIKQKIFDLQAR